jgi:hypothetical protein
VTEAHLQTRTLTESIWYPPHDARKASAEYKKVHAHLVNELDEPCWICGVKQSELPKGQHNETHHWHIEWALVNRIDPTLIIADFPAMGEADDPHLREWLDSEGNMLILCSAHHRHGLVGIHSITYPAFVAQRWLKNGHDISEKDPA